MKLFMRLIIVITLAAVILSIIAGCKGKPDDDDENNDNGNNFGNIVYNPDEFIFVPEFINIPGSLEEVTASTYLSGKIYLASREITDTVDYAFTTKLYTLEIDGSGLTEITDFTPEKPTDDSIVQAAVNAMSADDNGNIWAFVNTSIFRFDLPADFDGEDWERYDYIEDLGSGFKLLKLDSAGTELSSIDFSEIIDGIVDIRSIEIDDKGNIFVHVITFDGSQFTSLHGNSDIYVLSEDGAVQFILSAPELMSLSMIKMPDGTVAVTGLTDNAPHKRMLMAIDITAKSWREGVELPNEAGEVFSGNEGFDLLLNDGNSLYSFSLNTGEQTKILQWLDSNIINRNMKDIRLLPDGRILCIEQEFNFNTHRFSFRLIILTKTDRSDIPERIVLTLAGLYINHHIELAVMEFNASNFKYSVEVVDYSQYDSDGDWDAGRTRLTTEIISGKVPDIIVTNSLPFRQFANKGLFEDLYPYIDSDNELDRNSFIENAFRISEIDGSLYQVFTSFSIQTIVGNPLILGPQPGWTIEEFMSVMAENPQAVRPMGPIDLYSLYRLILFNWNEYIDWSAGVAHFDRGDFAELLRWAYQISSYGDSPASNAEMIASGEQIMEQPMFFADFSWFQVYRTAFGGDLVFKGFPAANRNGNYMSLDSGLAITSTCKDKEGAWEFVRLLLTDEWQKENLQRLQGFPTNKAAFDEVVRDAMYPQWPKHSHWGGLDVVIGAATQEEIDQVLALIDSMSSALFHDTDLWIIIREGIDDFFNGRNTAEDTARIIQNRVSRFLAEQN
jgi:ABC-type glycerol-3-phosphate transport system substrate-binding protein